MSLNRAVLSGPQALEWFLPGSTVGNLPWHFLVPSELGSIAAMKRALELSGV